MMMVVVRGSPVQTTPERADVLRGRAQAGELGREGR